MASSSLLSQLHYNPIISILHHSFHHDRLSTSVTAPLTVSSTINPLCLSIITPSYLLLPPLSSSCTHPKFIPHPSSSPWMRWWSNEGGEREGGHINHPSPLVYHCFLFFLFLPYLIISFYWIFYVLRFVRQQTPPCWCGKNEQVAISYRWTWQTWYKQLDISFFLFF